MATVVVDAVVSLATGSSTVQRRRRSVSGSRGRSIPG